MVVDQVPIDENNPEATDGYGLNVNISSGEFITINGPAIQIEERPIHLSCWFYVDNPHIMYALGAYTDFQGETGAASYTLRYAPELIENTWQEVEILINSGYTVVQPFIVIFNGDEHTAGTAFIDTLKVTQGVTIDTDSSESIELDEWIPNLWLDSGECGDAYEEDGHLVLEKGSDCQVSRMAGIFTQTDFPNQIDVEIDLIKEYGESGNLTLWIGTGPNSLQTDIPLWMLNQGEEETLSLSGIINELAGPMHVIIQIEGQDDERVIINEVRIQETNLNLE